MAHVWTDFVIDLTVSGVDLTAMEDITVTIRQGQIKQTFVGADMIILKVGADSTVSFNISQRLSGAYKPSCPIAIQVNWLNNGARDCSEIGSFYLSDNLQKEVL